MGELENNLRAALDGRPLTWLAERTGINRNTLSSYLKGTCPTLENAYNIADVLGKTVYEIWPWPLTKE